MSDEKKLIEVEVELTWENIPREAKQMVYSHLREACEKALKDGATALIYHKMSGAAGLSAVADGQALIADAFTLAREELELADPELCQDCRHYHDDAEPAQHKNPKDMS